MSSFYRKIPKDSRSSSHFLSSSDPFSVGTTVRRKRGERGGTTVRRKRGERGGNTMRRKREECGGNTVRRKREERGRGVVPP